MAKQKISVSIDQEVLSVVSQNGQNRSEAIEGLLRRALEIEETGLVDVVDAFESRLKSLESFRDEVEESRFS